MTTEQLTVVRVIVDRLNSAVDQRKAARIRSDTFTWRHESQVINDLLDRVSPEARQHISGDQDVGFHVLP